MPLQAQDLEDLDNLDPDDFDEELDTAEKRGDVVDSGEPAGGTEAADQSDDEDDVVEPGETAEADDEEPDDETTDETEEETDDAGTEEDTEETAEEEPEEDTEEAAESEDVADDPRIPKSRFDSVNARRKEAERKLAELQSQIDKTGESGQRADRVSEIQNELGTLDDQINDAILDADAAKLKELRAKERELNNEALQFQLRSATSQAAEEAKYDALLDKVETDYPEYNPDAEAYNEEMVSETLRLQKALMASGSSKGDALVEAIDLIRPRYVTEETQAKKTSLRDEPKPKRDTKTNTKRNKKVAQSQPANTATRSSKMDSSEDIDFDNLQQPEDLDKFDEKTLARLSGDVVD